jgi:hypothetical protein
MLASALGITGASVITGAGMGAATGGLVGTLMSINMPEKAARHYALGVDKGHILITVAAEGDDETVIRELLARHGGESVDT